MPPFQTCISMFLYLTRAHTKISLQTYTGNILIVMNPFIKLCHLYHSRMMAQYKGVGFGELSPHPFAVVDVAYG